MAYVTKEYRKKLVGYFKDFDYCVRHFYKVHYNQDSYSKEYYLELVKRLNFMYELFLGLLEDL